MDSIVVYQPGVSEPNSLSSSVLVDIADKQALASSLPYDPLALDREVACPLRCEYEVCDQPPFVDHEMFETIGRTSRVRTLWPSEIPSHCEQILESHRRSDCHPGSPANLTHCRDFLTFGYNSSEHLAVLRVLLLCAWELEGTD
jgi:hypothetical protein